MPAKAVKAKAEKDFVKEEVKEPGKVDERPVEPETKEPLPEEVERPPSAALKPCVMVCRHVKCKWIGHCYPSEGE